MTTLTENYFFDVDSLEKNALRIDGSSIVGTFAGKFFGVRSTSPVYDVNNNLVGTIYFRRQIFYNLNTNEQESENFFYIIFRNESIVTSSEYVTLNPGSALYPIPLEPITGIHSDYATGIYKQYSAIIYTLTYLGKKAQITMELLPNGYCPCHFN